MRMEMPQRTARDDTKWNNRIVNMQRRVWGKHYYMLPWFNRNPIDTTNVHNALRERNIPLHLNTTRGLTPGLKDLVYRSLSLEPAISLPISLPNCGVFVPTMLPRRLRATNGTSMRYKSSLMAKLLVLVATMLPARLNDVRHRLVVLEIPMVGVEAGRVTGMVEVYVSVACI